MWGWGCCLSEVDEQKGLLRCRWLLGSLALTPPLLLVFGATVVGAQLPKVPPRILLRPTLLSTSSPKVLCEHGSAPLHGVVCTCSVHACGGTFPAPCHGGGVLSATVTELTVSNPDP